MLISEETSRALDVLTGAFFDLNRTLDRCVTWMQNEWSMPNAADIVHHNLAHLMPLVADEITAIKDNYNMTSVYPATHEDSRTYQDLADMMETVLDEFTETYTMLKLTKDIIKKNDDFNVLSDLYRIMRQFNIIMGQIYTLRDKAVQMPVAYDTYDRHISSWGIDGVDLNCCQAIGDDD